MDKEKIDEVEEVIECSESDFNKKDFEEIRLLGDKKFKFYEKMRATIDKWTKKRTGKAGYEIAQYLMLLPDLFMLVSRLIADKRVPLGKKAFLAAVLAYIISPIDIIPDFIPFIGYTDDLFMVIFALDNLLNNVQDNVIIENWTGKENIIVLVRTLLEKSDQFIDKNVLKKIRKWIWKKS
ncbi:DUF1232 domain-containing protein [bacterium]|nr:DUF1232 domain-containing protein [bacterium]